VRRHHEVPTVRAAFLILSAAAVAGTAGPLPVARAAAGLVAGYGFAEGSGTTTADVSGNGVAGTLVGGPAWTAGHSGTGLSFNGSAAYVDLGNPAALRFTGSMTLSAWVKEAANVVDDGQIIAKSDDGSGWQLKSTPDTGVRTFGVAVAGSGGTAQRYSTTVRSLNVWYHVTGVYDASARTLNIYVNGALDNGVLSGTVPGSIVGSTVNANIGRRTGGFYINGVVDDVRVYDHALTLAEIQADMNTPVAPDGPPAFDFTMANGGDESVVRGSAVANDVSVTLAAGTPQAVSFAVSGLPAGATGTFSPTSCTPSCSSTLNIATPATTPAGTSVVTVIGTGGGLSRATTFSLTVSTGADLVPPSVALTAPAGGAVVAGTAVTVSAAASDNVGVSGVQFLLDGASLGAEDTASPYSITWNTTTTTSAIHQLSARARDAAGNSASAASVPVVVDNQPPTGSLVINGGASATNSRTVTLTLAASDPLSGVSQMRFSNNGNSYSTPEAYATGKTWTLSIGQGTKTVYAQFKDGAGNWSAAFTDTIVLDTAAPSISGVASSNVTSASARITWTTTEPATSQVEYGPTTAYGSSSVLDPTLTTAHSVMLSGLAAQTLYNYRVRSADAAGNLRLGGNNTFTTTGTDTSAPTVPGNLVATAASPTVVNLSWTASTDNVGVTGYDVLRDGVAVGTPASPSFQDSGLSPATTYSYRVSARDAAGNVSAPSSPAAVTTPAFVISNVASSSVTTTSAVIAWSTDAPASSQVEYGPTTAYGSLGPLDAALKLAHSQTLTGLAANTAYHYRVRSVDAAGHLEQSGDFVFTTSPSSAGGFQNEVLITGLNLPTAVKFLPDGDMAVLELGGRIWKVDTTAWEVRPDPLLVLTNIGTENGQQGLMDMVLDPAFASNHYYYVFYTLGSPNRDRVSRFTANADVTGTVAGSEFVIYEDPQDASSEHHGGALNFGNDGKLYVTTGEHFDPDASQSLASPRGKLLRFNKDGTVPTDNPFYDGAGPNFDAVWALGLRNPFRASYDAPTGRLFIGDVGGNVYSTAEEEVHLGARGANYGWPICEGFSCGSDPRYTSPIYAYPHDGRDASITGGFVYRGTQFPSPYYGSYFFADYAQNWIKRLTFDASGNVNGVFNFEPPDGSADGPYGDIVQLCEGPDGALYYVDLGYSDTTGQVGISKIRRIRFVSSNQPPTVVASGQPTAGPAPLSVSFSSAGTVDPEGDPLSYAWTFGDGATSTEANPVHTYSANGVYGARLSVADGSTSTLSTPITIRVGRPPVPTILAPADGATFRAGDTITFTGDATDPDDGALPASAFTWNIDFLHEGHVHPGLPQVGVKSGTFVIPTSGHDFHGFTRYRITLTVTDSDGLQASQLVLIYPQKVNLTFDTVPSGLALTLDGIPFATPFVYDTLIGFNHTVEAANQTSGQNVYTFASWSDGGAPQHVIVVPPAAASYVATYSVAQNPPPPGLVAGYRFGEGAGTITADISGNNNVGTLVNGPAWTTGKYGIALSFGGTGYVDLGNATSLRLTGSMTLTAWIKTSANPVDDGSIVAKLGTAGWQLKTTPDTGPRTAAIQISSNGSDAIQRYGATVLATNTWYHVAGVYDAAARTLSVYVNGVLDNGTLSGSVPAAQYDAPYSVNIAQRPGNPELFNFLGTIDEVHVFNRALSAAEIQVDMNTPR
jgi:glucose/arabinose dehydrogenase